MATYSLPWRKPLIALTVPTCFVVSCLRMVDYEEPCDQRFDLSSDRLHCGACDNQCSSEKICVGGTCVCRDDQLDDCWGRCTNLSTDPASCGLCGNACSIGGRCENGQCVCDHTLCGWNCVDTDSSRFHCGACDNKCEIDKTCVGGVCT